MKLGDKLLIEVQVVDIGNENDIFHIRVDSNGLRNPVYICPSIIKKPGDIANKQMERMYEVLQKLSLPTKDGGLHEKELKKIFGDVEYGKDLFAKYTAEEFCEKVLDYFENERLRVGDIVITHDDIDEKGVVTYLDYRCGVASILWYDGSCGEHSVNKITKVKGDEPISEIFRILERLKQED